MLRCFRASESEGSFAKEDSFAKKDRAAFAGGPSQGGNALGGQQQRGAIADLVLQIKKPRALTGLNLCSRFFCSRYIHAVDASYRDADHVGGRPHDPRINSHLVPRGMLPRS